MRILFVGDYSNLHATLAEELRRQGHTAHVLSDRCGYMDTHSDFYLKRDKGITGAFKYLYDIFSILPSLKDYDVVQLINTNFLSLKPGKIKYFFDRIHEQNGSVFLTLAGDDYYFCKACLEGKIFRFSEFKTGEEFTEFHKETPHRLYGWLSNSNKKWAEYLYDKIDGAHAVLPEYDMAAKELLGDRLTFTNLPIDFSKLPTPVYNANYPINIFVGMRSGMELQKGTNKLWKLTQDFEKRFSEKVKAINVRDLPLKTYLEMMNQSHIVLDQLYAYSPAMNALYAMALGKIAGSGAQPEYYEYIGNPDIKPVFGLSPFDNDIEDRLEDLIENPDKIIERGKLSRDLVLKNNDTVIVTDRFLRHWKNILNKKNYN